jgi:transcription elongation factor GreA
MEDKYPMTQAGFDRLEAELKALKTVERPAVIQAIAEAREHGDLSENAEYHAAREKQSFIEGRVMELEAVIAHAEVHDIASFTGKNIKFGATVKIVDEETDEEVTYQLVGDYEADIEQGRLAISAPIAKALIGKMPGDSVEVKTPKGERYYEVLEVAFN